MNALNQGIGWVCLVLGALSIASGIFAAFRYQKTEIPVPTTPKVGDHGAINDAIKNSVEFAKALKELDLTGKLLTVGVLLIAVAAIVAGLDTVADALKS